MSNEFATALSDIINNNLESDVEGIYRATGKVTEQMLPDDVTVEQYNAVHGFDSKMLAATIDLTSDMAAGHFADSEFNGDKVTLEVPGIGNNTYMASVIRNENDEVHVSAGMEFDLSEHVSTALDKVNSADSTE